jgi:protein O-mannosyl-transferase
MGRKSRSKKRQPAELRDPKRFEPTASAGNDKSAAGRAPASLKNWLFAAALVIAVFLAYQPAWRSGFIWDDDVHLLNNPVLKSGGLAGAWTPGSYINFWPLTFTVYRLEFEAWGLNLLGYHLVNIALHAAAALLVWRLLVELNVPGAMLAAAIFALHPVNVESVAWIAQLKGLLSLLFALVSALFYLQYDRKGCWWRYAAALAAFSLSTLAKGMVITLPVVLLACAWWRSGSLQWRDLMRVLPFVLIGALMAGVEVWTQSREGSDVVRTDSLLSRSAVAGCAVWFYLGKLLWPLNLCFVYPRWKIDDGEVLSYLPGLLLLVIVFALALWRRRSWGRPVVMLIVCYAALLLPVLGFVNISFMQWSLVADHWQYAATIVPAAVLTGAAANWAFRQPGRRPVAYALGLALLAAFAVLTWRKSQTYADLETFWSDTLAKNPDCAPAHNNLGNILVARGQVEEAITHYRKALEIKPDYFDAHNNLGHVLADLGQIDDAIAHYRKALEINPDYAEVHITLAAALAGRGQFDEAIDHCRKALQIKPDHAEGHINLGAALAGRGQVDEAIAHFRKALEIKPDHALARLNLGKALAGRGQVDEAIVHFRKALEIKPDDAEAHNYLGLALGSRGLVDEAIAHYRMALEMRPEYASAHYNLGTALAGLGQVDEAITHYRKALEIKPDYAEAHNNLGLALAGSGQVDEGIAHYRKALETRPDYALAYFNLGSALAHRGKLDEALQHYQKALDLASARNDWALADNIRIKMRLAGKGQ